MLLTAPGNGLTADFRDFCCKFQADRPLDPLISEEVSERSRRRTASATSGAAARLPESEPALAVEPKKGGPESSGPPFVPQRATQGGITPPFGSRW